ncbi:uncharacterized protein LOC124492505 [Dermatophagoides farinae]|uniref:Marvel domain containing protein n=1 Tax=Dermatophagoides farinae TaxID=6954 RepID=A0A922ICK9_DERFA|nr:uncharacterized protein LOC124492505 [Dermatophagoides farinae]KAH7642339.1 marvel domain containing protein [Dermatophagoides farinae]KAH9529552.1 hypothetical protein DERF_003431 [Dermatophagoides farinae]
MPTATVQVRQTTTTTTARSSVIVINTGYLSSKLGLLKFLIMIFSLIAFIMALMHFDNYNREVNIDSDRFLLLVSFADWVTVTLMLIAALLSLGSATILPKASFDFIFHFILGILMLIAGLWAAATAFADPQRNTYIQAASVCAAICGIIQIVHGIFSYRLCITN